jgi:hypothetical protein
MHVDAIVACQGWGVVSVGPLPPATFVCQYVGELLTSADADARLAEYDDADGMSSEEEESPCGHALLVSV